MIFTKYFFGLPTVLDPVMELAGATKESPALQFLYSLVSLNEQDAQNFDSFHIREVVLSCRCLERQSLNKENQYDCRGDRAN